MQETDFCRERIFNSFKVGINALMCSGIVLQNASIVEQMSELHVVMTC